jgi:hypothetical protein
LLLDKLRRGGLMSFYAGSFAFDIAERVIADLVASNRLEPAAPYKTLRHYRKP